MSHCREGTIVYRGAPGGLEWHHKNECNATQRNERGFNVDSVVCHRLVLRLSFAIRGGPPAATLFLGLTHLTTAIYIVTIAIPSSS